MVDHEAPSAPNDFRRKCYAVVRNAVPETVTDLVATYAELRENAKELQPDVTRNGDQIPGDPQATGFGNYGTALEDAVLLSIQPIVEEKVGYRLIPTYSYLRVYGPNAVLSKHTDRPSCEISATLTIGYDSQELWPICVERDGESIAVDLDRGDMMIYMGCQVPHWREGFHGQRWVQMFLHYVIADGDLAHFGHDRRPALGQLPSSADGRMPKFLVPPRFMARPRMAGRILARRVKRRLYRALHGRKYEMAELDVSDDESRWGLYAIGHDDILKLEPIDGRIDLTRFSASDIEFVSMFPERNGTLFARDENVQVGFSRDGDASVTGLDIHWRGVDYRARKITYAAG